MKDFLAKTENPTIVEEMIIRLTIEKYNISDDEKNTLYEQLDQLLEADPSLLLKYHYTHSLIEYAYVYEDCRLLDILLKHDKKNNISAVNVTLTLEDGSELPLINFLIESLNAEFVLKFFGSGNLDKLQLDNKQECCLLTLAILNPAIKEHKVFKDYFGNIGDLYSTLIKKIYVNGKVTFSSRKIEDALGEDFINNLDLETILSLEPNMLNRWYNNISYYYGMISNYNDNSQYETGEIIKNIKSIISNKSYYKRLFDVARQKGDIDKLGIYIKDNINLKYNGETALHLATRNNYHALISLLLQLGADVNIKNEGGWTALWVGNKDTELLLLQAIKDPFTIIGPGKYTAFHLAARRGYTDQIKSWVEQGLITKDNFNLPKEDGWTALHLAAKNNHPALISLLLQLGADVNIKNKDGNTALWVGNKDTELLLLQAIKDPFAIIGPYGYTAFHLAAMRGYTDQIKSWVEQGLITKDNVNLSKEDGWTALHLAAGNNYPALISLLLQLGADVNIKNKSGKSAFGEAEDNICKVLLKSVMEGSLSSQVRM